MYPLHPEQQQQNCSSGTPEQNNGLHQLTFKSPTQPVSTLDIL